MSWPAHAVVRLLLAAAAVASQPSLNVYFQSTLTDSSYQKSAFTRVAQSWKSPAGKSLPKPGAKAVIQAVIARDGRLVSTSVSTRSGSRTWDEAGLAAVKKAAPFGALPPGYKFPSVEAHFHFALEAK